MSDKKWEYSTLELIPTKLKFVSVDTDLATTLAKHGREGWELTTSTPGTKPDTVLMFFKRKIQSHKSSH